MAKKAEAPRLYRLELELSEEEVEKLASGRCPKRIWETAWEMLAWKREAMQDWASYPATRKRPR